MKKLKINRRGVTAVVMHYYTPRLKYLNDILEGLSKSSTKIDSTIVWNNDSTSWRAVEFIASNHNATVVNSPVNVGCLGRYLASMFVETTDVLFQDNDLIVHPNLVGTLLSVNCMIAGCIGRTFEDTKTPYITATFGAGNCDVVVGRVSLMPTSFARYVLTKSYTENLIEHMFRCDDIVASCLEPKVNKYTLGKNLFDNLDEEGLGLSHHPDHYTNRDALCRSLIEKGFFK